MKLAVTIAFVLAFATSTRSIPVAHASVTAPHCKDIATNLPCPGDFPR